MICFLFSCSLIVSLGIKSFRSSMWITWAWAAIKISSESPSAIYHSSISNNILQEILINQIYNIEITIVFWIYSLKINIRENLWFVFNFLIWRNNRKIVGCLAFDTITNPTSHPTNPFGFIVLSLDCVHHNTKNSNVSPFNLHCKF